MNMTEEEPKKKVIEVEKEKRYTAITLDIQNENASERYQESVSIVEREILRFELPALGTNPSKIIGSPFAEGTTSTNVSGSDISGSCT